ncbi:MAG: LysE family transporter [Pseudomonadota bacterium]
MLNFIVSVILLIGTPGPGVLTLAGVGAAFGFRSGLKLLAGLFVGHNLISIFVITGLAAAVLANPQIRTFLATAVTGYFLWLAFRIATAGTRIAFVEKMSPPGFAGGLALQAINPKAYAVSTAIFASFPLFEDDFIREAIVKLVIFNAIWLVSHSAWLWFGAAIRRLDLPQRTQRKINFAMAAALVTVVALAAWQTFFV